MKILGLIISLIGIYLFYLVFFKLAPFVASHFSNELVIFLCYAGIGYFGGVAIPIIITGFGIVMIIKSL